MRLTVTDYATLGKTIKAFAANDGLNMLFIVGRHGQAKTRHIQDAIGPRSLWFEGQVSAFGLYRELYFNAHTEFVVMDDVNTVRNDDNLVRLMKCLCQTEPIKEVAWHTTNHLMMAEDIPQHFKTRARVCFIVNEGRNANPHFAALMDRGLVIHFTPSPQTVLAEAKKWFKSKDVIKFVEQHIRYIPVLSMRDMLHAEKMRQHKLEWQKALAESLGIKDLLVVERLLNDRGYATDEKRIKAFADETGLSRTTWFQLAKRLREIPRKDSPRIVLSMDGILKPSRKARKKVAI
jgi:hypothetical protein